MEVFPEEVALKNGSADWGEFGTGYAEKGNGHSRSSKLRELRQEAREQGISGWISACVEGEGWISKSGKEF